MLSEPWTYEEKCVYNQESLQKIISDDTEIMVMTENTK